MRCRHWSLTLNNYTEEHIDTIARSYEEGNILYIVYGKEVGASGTPHLQGAVSFADQTRRSKALKLLGVQAHLEPARNLSKLIEYCKKDGDVTEFGTVKPTNPGRRSDLEEFKSAVKAGNRNRKDLREKFSDVWARYKTFCESYLNDTAPTPRVKSYPLHPWQTELYEKLRREPDDRSIVFVVDYKGNNGKSWFADYYLSIHPDKTQILEPGKKADMAYNLDDDLRVVFFDCPRSKQGDFIQYDFLEACKNGRVFSPKYESRTKRYDPMHVVVLMNEEPDMSKLSEDRYSITHL